MLVVVIVIMVVVINLRHRLGLVSCYQLSYALR